MFKLKQKPEDFYVKEIMEPPIIPSGSYAYYHLWKRDYNTSDALIQVAKAWNLNMKFINFAGTKDKRAITEQYISIQNGPRKDYKTKDLKLFYIGQGQARINLGTHDGNFFRIVARNISARPKPIDRYKNYFDQQRFGTENKNHIIGKAIIQGDYEHAVAMIGSLTALEHLKRQPNDYVGALKMIPKHTLKLYVHAYQSYLWNDMAQSSNEEIVPIIGFNTETTPEIEKILEREGIRTLDFVNRQIPQISAEGAMRKVYADVRDLEIGELDRDEENEGMHKVTIEFSLDKGAYATQAVAAMFKGT